MSTNRITAVFNNRAEAQEAIHDLRRLGVADDQIAVVARHDNNTGGADNTVVDHDDTGDRTGKGLLAGAGVGALFGIAAALIPGVGPFITAGWLASSLGAIGGGAVAGAVVGGTSGAVAGALSKAGYNEQESHYYGSAVEQGGVLVAVDANNNAISVEEVRAILSRHHGQTTAAAY